MPLRIMRIQSSFCEMVLGVKRKHLDPKCSKLENKSGKSDDFFVMGGNEGGTEDTPKEHKCTICDKVFEKANGLKAHLSRPNIHIVKPFKCDRKGISHVIKARC